MKEADEAAKAILSRFPGKSWDELPDDVRSVVGYYNAERIGLLKTAEAVIQLRRRMGA